MSSHSSMQVAIELATRQRDQRARELAQALGSLQHAQGQIGQLQGYASETDARWLARGPGGVDSVVMQNHYQFMDKLQEAIQIQTRVVVDAEQSLAVRRQALLEADQRLATWKEVLARMQAEQRARQARTEQKQSDELATQQFERRRRETETSGESHDD